MMHTSQWAYTYAFIGAIFIGSTQSSVVDGFCVGAGLYLLAASSLTMVGSLKK